MNKTYAFLFSLIVLLFVADSTQLYAQKYGTAFGFRGGRSGIGLTGQHRIFPNTTVEGIFSFGTEQMAFTGLVEYHRPLIFFKSLNYYVGAGAHIGNLKENGKFYGLDGIFGIEYKIPIFPILLSYDIKPAFHLEHPKSVEWHTGVSVRYVIVTHRELRKRKKRKERAKKKEEKAERREEKKENRKGWKDIFKKKDKDNDSKNDSRNKNDKDKSNDKKKEGWKDIFKKKDKNNDSRNKKETDKKKSEKKSFWDKLFKRD